MTSLNKNDVPIVFSDIDSIQSLISNNLQEINNAGIKVSRKKIIPYGTQLTLNSDHGSGLINIYYSKKKGISFIDCSKNSISAKVITILRAKEKKTMPFSDKIDMRERMLKVWIGTDESGKGDFFGPLVIAAFLISRDIENDVASLGVTDSKRLTSKQIHSIARSLWKKYPEHIEVVAPSNTKYNQLYDKFKNLNKFLAWGHARAIENLVKKWDEKKKLVIDGVVADKFGHESRILSALASMRTLNLIQRTGGESNIAVAAASIIARSAFERHIDRISKECGMKIPFGAGPHVIKAAKQYANKNGKEKLSTIAKIHFKTFQRI